MPTTDRLRRQLDELPFVRLAVLFGSRARGMAGRSSDFDLGVALEPDTARTRLKLEQALWSTLHDELDLIHLGTAPPLLRFEICRDGVLLREREPGLWIEFKAKAMVDWWDWAPIARRSFRTAVERLKKSTRHGQA